MHINLNQLRAFFWAARERSVTKAAEILFVSQPAVTMQIKFLEEALEVKLFKKSGKSLELTDVGKVLFGYAQRIFEIIEEMEYALKGHAQVSQGTLTIGTTRSFARHLMPGLLSRFQENFPGIRVVLEEGSSQEIADGLVKFKYDLGIVGRIPYDGKLKAIPYTQEEFCLVAPPGHRFADREAVSIRELEQEPIIIREEGSGSRHAILSLLRSHDVKPSVLVEAGSVEFIKEYIIKGRGVTFLYKPEVDLEAKMGLLITMNIQEGPILIHTDLILPKKMELSPPARAFLKLVESNS